MAGDTEVLWVALQKNGDENAPMLMNFVIEQIPLYKLKIDIFDLGRYNSTDLGIVDMDNLQLEGF